jgi:UDP-N-acetylmuramoylalanine--D-glutamate ligase
MIRLPQRANQTLAVLGLGISGIATARALVASSAKVMAWDDGEEARKAAAAAGVAVADLSAADWSAISALVMSPGIPLTHPEPHVIARLARQHKKPIIGDIELLWESCGQASYIGITGTNGKSTTTALIHHLLNTPGRAVQVGGNLGPAALGLEPLGLGGIYVLEVSSFQLDLTDRMAFDVAVFLNITPDHLYRHGGIDGYVAAKKRIFRSRPRGAQTAVVGVDDEYGRAMVAELRGKAGWRVVPIAVGRAVEGGVYAIDGKLFDATAGAATRPVADIRRVTTLPGAHNWQNAAAAYAATRAVGASQSEVAAGLKTYPGLPHRQELIATVGGVRFVNDSKATNDDSTAKALVCYDAIYLILGGLPKEGGLAFALPHFGAVRHAFLIGTAAQQFEREIAGRVPATQCGDLATATEAAFRQARADRVNNATVLLSPACASFDQFKNFGDRGDTFRRLVDKIQASLKAEAKA